MNLMAVLFSRCSREKPRTVESTSSHRSIPRLAERPYPCVVFRTKTSGYIYNPFSDGNYWYRNNNEGQTMAAMNKAAETDAAIQTRIDLFRYRVLEAFRRNCSAHPQLPQK